MANGDSASGGPFESVPLLGAVASKDANTIKLLLPTFLYFTALNSLAATFPALLSDLLDPDDYESDAALSAAASEWNIYIGFFYAIPSILMVAFFGVLSDYKGRIFVIVIQCTMMGIGMIFIYLVALFEMHIAYLFVGNFVWGMCGYYPTYLAAAFAYVADSSSIAQRARQFGYLTASLYFGDFVGPYLGGLLYDEIGIWAPFLACGCMFFLVALYYFFLIPESLPEEKRTKVFKLRDASVFGVLKILGERRVFIYMTVVYMLGYSILVAMQFIFAFYTMLVFDWSTSETGLLISLFWLYRSIAVGGFIPLMFYFFPESKGYWPPMIVVRIGLVSYVISMVLFGVVQVGILFFAIGVLYALGAIMTVSLRSLFSQSVEHKRQGLMLSSVAFLELIETAAGNPIYQAIYTASADSIPALTFYVAGALALISLLMTGLIRQKDVLYVPSKLDEHHESVNSSDGSGAAVVDGGSFQKDVTADSSSPTTSSGGGRHEDAGGAKPRSYKGYGVVNGGESETSRSYGAVSAGANGGGSTKAVSFKDSDSYISSDSANTVAYKS